MSRQQVRDQAALLKRAGTTVRCVDDGENVVVLLESYTPPNCEKFEPNKLDALAFLVPAVFPEACPDQTGFFVRPASIKLAGQQAAPTNTSATHLLGESWLKFSWMPKGGFTWDPEIDTLETHLSTLEKRFLTGK